MPPRTFILFCSCIKGVFVRFQCEGRGYIYSVILLEHCTHISNFFWQQYKYTHGLTLKLRYGLYQEINGITHLLHVINVIAAGFMPEQRARRIC
jgi:hypothetical protein